MFITTILFLKEWGGLGECPPRKFWNLDAWKCYFHRFPESIRPLKQSKLRLYTNHILCLLQLFFSSKSQLLALRKEWNDKSSNADSKKYIQCFKFKLSYWKNVLSNVCLCIFVKIGGLSKRIFETRTATGSELFSLSTYFSQPHSHCQVSCLL